MTTQNKETGNVMYDSPKLETISMETSATILTGSGEDWDIHED